MIYVDTSALLAILDDDTYHQKAQRCWKGLFESGEPLKTNNYVMIESHAIIQNRVGVWAIQKLVAELLPAIELIG